MNGSQQRNGPQGHLAPVADGKNTPLTYPKPQNPAEDSWLWVRRLGASLCLPPGTRGTLSLWGWKQGKEMQSHIDRGHVAHSRSPRRGQGDSRRGPGGKPGLDTFQVWQAQLLLSPGNAVDHQNTALACFHLGSTHAQQCPRGHCPCPASQPI